MKIVLLRKNDASKQSLENSDGEKYIRTAFAHISRLIWIKSIVISKPQGSAQAGYHEQITLECSPKESVLEDQALVKAVMDAVKLCSDLQLRNIWITPTKQVDAIKKLDDDTYQADLFYSDFLARNSDYREQVKNEPVEKVTFEVQLKNDYYVPTGKIGTIYKQNASQKFDSNNIYNCYAAALSSSEELRDSIINSDLSSILLKFNEQHELQVKLMSVQKFKFNFASASPRSAKASRSEIESNPVNFEPYVELDSDEEEFLSPSI